ncbi:MAG: UDP-N-acetylmuramate--L-alanine ligase [Candidatus Eisenbacteria bacterium]|nr:UDP-N-acetylmuramate--L-alanine ligase [Candidatus Eisenbacteria bacterium]
MPHVHLIGIGGSGMSGLAGLFVQAGWSVTGCDKAAVHPPAADTLAALGIHPFLGYSPDHLDPSPDLVVVGNVVRATNEEDREALTRGMPRTHMAKALWDHFLSRRTSVVVAGTHGKTTSTSMLAYLLQRGGYDPGFFVGGVVRGLGTGYQLGSGAYFVTEGDEYDCAWFDKTPKFLHYRPRYLLVTNVEYDHADIYADLDAIREVFRRLIASLPHDGVLVYCAESPILTELAREAPCTVVSYAVDSPMPATWTASNIRVEAGGTAFTLTRGVEPAGEFLIRLPGRHNVLNATGVIALWRAMGLSWSGLADRISEFQGAARRMQVLARGDAVVLDDFAHHPTEVRATLSAARQWWPGRKMWAVFEPKTQTSRRQVLQADLAEALSLADEVVVIEPHDLESIPLDHRMDVARLADDVRARGVRTTVAATQEETAALLVEELTRETIVVLMSAGSLGHVADAVTSLVATKGWGSAPDSTRSG